MLNKNGGSELPCLVPDFRENAFIFFTTEYDVGRVFVIYVIYYIVVVSFYTHFIECFNKKWIGILSNSHIDFFKHTFTL